MNIEYQVSCIDSKHYSRLGPSLPSLPSLPVAVRAPSGRIDGGLGEEKCVEWVWCGRFVRWHCVVANAVGIRGCRYHGGGLCGVDDRPIEAVSGSFRGFWCVLNGIGSGEGTRELVLGSDGVRVRVKSEDEVR